MRRGWAWVGVALLWFLLGPWVVVAALVALVHPVVRDRFLPGLPSRRTAAISAAVVVVATLTVWVVPDGWLPVPPGPGRWVTPTYVGRAALDHPVDGLRVPQHPHLARNGTATSSADAWATGAVRWSGPEGDRTQVASAWFGREHCPTLVPLGDRLLGLCSGAGGPALHLLDRRSMHVAATRELPKLPDWTGVPPRPELCGLALFVDDRGDAVVATADRKIWRVSTGDEELGVGRTTDLSHRVPPDDCVVGLLPDWRAGTWFVTERGRVGLVANAGSPVRVLDLEEQVTSPVAVDATGFYVVTTQALYRLSADDTGRPRVTWRTTYDNGIERKSGQPSQGSGSGPTLLPAGLVAVTDNADPRMSVLFLHRDTGDEVCRAPVFEAGHSATGSPLAAVGPASVVVTNNEGYDGPLSTALGRTTSAGMARVDVVGGRCRVAWTNDVVSPSAGAHLSRANGLLYAWTTRHSWLGVSGWYLTAVDATTGHVVFGVRAGNGWLMDNDHGRLAIALDGSAYVGTRGGLVRLWDRTAQG